MAGKLKKIKMSYSYQSTAECCREIIPTCDRGTPHQRVETALHEVFCDDMQGYGMDRLAVMLQAALFEINENALHHDTASEVFADIEDFETGEYDDLFSDEDIELIKADVKKVKEYFLANTERLKYDD